MAWRRIPRKIKKALKQLELAPRTIRHGWFQTIQFGIYRIQGKRTKWTRKAEKVLRAREATKLSNLFREAWKSLPPFPDFSRTAKEIDDLYFEWKVIPNYK